MRGYIFKNKYRTTECASKAPNTRTVYSPNRRKSVFLILPFLYLLFISFLFFPGAAAADFTVVYDKDGKNFFKPAAAGNTQTGDFLVTYLDPVQCTGPSPDWGVRATWRNSVGGIKTTGLAPLGACGHRAIGRPAVAYSPQSDVFCVVAPTTARPIGPFFVMVGFVNGNGTSVEPFNVNYILGADNYYEGDSGHGSLHVIHNSLLDEFVVTVQVTESGTNRIWAQRISPSGSTIGSRVELDNFGPNGINYHGIAYAPVNTPAFPNGGRYLYMTSNWTGSQLLNADLVPILVGCHHDESELVCEGEYLDLWFGDNESGNHRGNSTHFDIAYGVIEGKNRFLMVYSDQDNCIPGKGICPDGSGVWGIFVDPEREQYVVDIDPRDHHNTYPTPFPITKIFPSDGTGNFCHYAENNWYKEWKPRVSYSADAQAFAVVWRETPLACEGYPVNEKYSHIRGAWVEKYVEDGNYGTDIETKFGYPMENIGLTDVESGSCDPWYDCDSYKDPDFADVVPVGGGTAAAVWHELFDPIDFPTLIFPPRWSIRGDLFPRLPGPENDDCGDAIPIDVGQHTGTLYRALNDGNSSCVLFGQTDDRPDVWYSFTAPSAGKLSVTTCGTNDTDGIDLGIDTVLSIHTSCPGNSGNQVVCNDDWMDYAPSKWPCLGQDKGIANDSAVYANLDKDQSILVRVSSSTKPLGPFELHVGFEPTDADEDGYTVADGDCDDNDNSVYPGASELCDGKDNDCNDSVDDNLSRLTTCGLGECAGNTGTETCSNGEWVNDTCDPYAGSSEEICDGKDNDCNDSVDDNLSRLTTCGLGECAGNTGTETCSNGEWVNDTCDPYAGASEEICDGKDNDCNGAYDENLSRQTTCGLGECAGNVGSETCSNGEWVNDTCDPYAGASEEICDGKDNDCNGAYDENLSRQTTCGLGECAGNVGSETCSNGEWVNDTCDPYAGATEEICDGIDNDCDGPIDEDAGNIYYGDGDGDGYGNQSDTQQSCSTPTGYVSESGDCNDDDNTIYPGATELCDGKDNNCNNINDIDEGVCNTPPSEEPVTIQDDTGQVTITFPNVTVGGDTGITVEECVGGIVGVTLAPTAPLCADIETSEDFEFDGQAEICIEYDDTGLTPQEESELKMVRCPPPAGKCELLMPCEEDNSSTENNILCACTDHFSVFAVGIPDDTDEDGVPDLSDHCPYLWDPTDHCLGCIGDFDEDNDVDGLDFSAFINDFGNATEGADFNRNGLSESGDVEIFVSDYGRTDCWYCIDGDEDDYGDGKDCIDSDCDDTRPEVNPEAQEVCNGVDDNCNDEIDESGVCCGNGTCEEFENFTTCPDDCEPAEGTPCEDGDSCTANDTYQSGVCAGDPLDCNDGDLCTEDSCDSQSGCIYTPITCEDEDICTVDSCDPQTGCVHVIDDCDDGNPCTEDYCFGWLGEGCFHQPIFGCNSN